MKARVLNIMPLSLEKHIRQIANKKIIKKDNLFLKYNTDDTFYNRPPYRYKIEFSKEAEYEAFEVCRIVESMLFSLVRIQVEILYTI